MLAVNFVSDTPHLKSSTMELVTVQDPPFLCLLLLTLSTVSSLPQVNLHVCVCARVRAYVCVRAYIYMDVWV